MTITDLISLTDGGAAVRTSTDRRYWLVNVGHRPSRSAYAVIDDFGNLVEVQR